jgi:hypothetical protein
MYNTVVADADLVLCTQRCYCGYILVVYIMLFFRLQASCMYITVAHVNYVASV